MYCAFDTETTGEAMFKLPYDAKCQPRVVQLGAILLDEQFKVRAELNLIVRPSGFEIPKEASDIHGITTEIALKYGVSASSVAEAFAELVCLSDVIVAHNIQFDMHMMGVFHELQSRCPDIVEFDENKLFCTMKGMMYECNIPNPYGYKDPKWPSLQEAHTHAFGKPFDGAHDAMADVRACADIFKWLKQKESAKNKPQTITKEEKPCLPSNPPTTPSA